MKCEVFNIEGARNVRDLGGYAANNGVTKKRRFIRAASLSNLTRKGIDKLISLGVDCVIDLRSTYETSRHPDAVAGHPDISHISVPMLDYIVSNSVQGIIEYPASMAEMYIGLLEKSTAEITRVFEIFALPYNTFLFHCTAGKDRTGVCAMLLLGLAGVDHETIIEDYTYTQILSGDVVRPSSVPSYLFDANPETMHEAISYLNQKFGSIQAYLEQIGLSSEQLDAVRDKLLL